MKRIIAVAMFLLTFVMAPSGFAQVTGLFPLIVVGNDTPEMLLVSDNLMAQQFSLSSPTYISRIDLALFAYVFAGGTCTFSVAITRSLGPGASYGTPVLQRSESSTGLGLAFPPVPLSDSFPAILLPAGTYFLVLDTTTGAYPCTHGAVGGQLQWLLASNDSPEVGTVGFTFSSGYSGFGIDPKPTDHFAFDLAGPVFVLPPTGGGAGQIARLVVEGPVTPAPGGPVEAQIGFVDPATGTPVAPLSTVTLNTLQTQSVDVALSSLGTRLGQHVDLLPVITQPPGAAQSSPIQLSATVQMLDAVTGFGTVLSSAPQPGASVPALGPQILGQRHCQVSWLSHALFACRRFSSLR